MRMLVWFFGGRISLQSRTDLNWNTTVNQGALYGLFFLAWYSSPKRVYHTTIKNRKQN